MHSHILKGLIIISGLIFLLSLSNLEADLFSSRNSTSSSITPGTGAPINLTVISGHPDELDLSWTNAWPNNTPPQNASIQIQQSTDGTTWTTIKTLSDPTISSYVVSGLIV